MLSSMWERTLYTARIGRPYDQPPFTLSKDKTDSSLRGERRDDSILLVTVKECHLIHRSKNSGQPEQRKK